MSSGATGFTTGTCAAAAAKAATMLVCGIPAPKEVEIGLPDGARVRLPIETVDGDSVSARAAVRKDAGDDPDVTDKCLVSALVELASEVDITFLAGEGVGTVTKPGLSVAPGEPAINPVPRSMIRDAVREVTARGLRITISIPGGKQLAAKTFNPRLGVEGGLSILGTSGIVRPFSGEAVRDALKCSLSVAVACNVKNPVFVPGRIGSRAALNLFELSPQQLIEVSNEWGYILDNAAEMDFHHLMALGHPGKLAKLAVGCWDTHSSRSDSAVPSVLDIARDVLARNLPESRTVEGIFNDLPEQERRRLADALAGRIKKAVLGRVSGRFEIAAVLVNMRGVLLGFDGDLQAWTRKTGPS
jgi:cobalt-precorrin-5B (C1)-methyltransferase